jgi:hydrogenase large subunit
VGPGIILNGKRYPFDERKITENIYHAWYKGDETDYRPESGYMEPDLYKTGAYSFVKAPRYNGYPMEVGPLARMQLSGEYSRGISAMDRTIARVLESNKMGEIITGLLQEIQPLPAEQKKYDIPTQSTGVGLTDTTRGSLGHWLSINEQKIDRYTIITPTAWNASPTDSKGILGVMEKALTGTYIQNEKQPVEIGRIVRSFDPCISCATHVLSNKYENFSIPTVML